MERDNPQAPARLSAYENRRYLELVRVCHVLSASWKCTKRSVFRWVTRVCVYQKAKKEFQEPIQPVSERFQCHVCIDAVI